MATRIAKKGDGAAARMAVAAGELMPAGTPMTVPLSSLDHSPDNPRKTRKPGDDASLRDSIRAGGLIQPLCARPAEGRFEVFAGHGRLEALRALAEEGRHGRDHPVPIHCFTGLSDEAARLMAISENVVRQAMDPLEECEAIAHAIHTSKISPDAIRRRFGMEPQEIRARLDIVGLESGARDLIARGDRTIPWGGAFACLTSDQKIEVMEAIASNASDYMGPQSLSNLAKRGLVPVVHARFDVGASGIAVVHGLFDGPGTGHFADTAAFWSLQNKAIVALQGELEAEGHTVEIYRTKTFLEAAWVKTDSAVGAHAVIEVAANGRVYVHSRLRKRGSENAVAEAAADDEIFGGAYDRDALGSGFDSASESVSTRPPGGKASAAIAKVRLDASAHAVGLDPELAMRVTLASILGDDRVPSALVMDEINAEDASEASVAMTAMRRAWSEARFAAASAATPFEYAMSLSDAKAAELFAVGTAVRLQHQRGSAIAFKADSIAKSIARRCNIDVRRGFVPNEDFFDAFSLQHLRDLAVELLPPRDGESARTSKRGDVVTMLAERFEAAAAGGRLDAETSSRLARWFPDYA